MTTATDVLAKARLDIGYNGTGTEDEPYSKFGAWYGINPGQWCAMAVSYWFSEAGMPVIHYAYCPTGVAMFQSGQWGTWHGPQEYLQPGDVIFWDYGLGRASHTGICEIGGGSGDLITSIQGNTTDASIGRTGNCCRRKQHYRSYMVGFGRPKFSTGVTTVDNSTPSTSSQIGGAAGAAQYTVQQGDTLASIAAANLIADWHTIYDLNKALIGPNPNAITPGMRLTLRAVETTPPEQPPEEEDDDMQVLVILTEKTGISYTTPSAQTKVSFKSGEGMAAIVAMVKAAGGKVIYPNPPIPFDQIKMIPTSKG